MKTTLRIGTRGNPLALCQAELVKARIHHDFPLLTIQIVIIKTGGDMIRRGSVPLFENKRIYTRELEEALLAGKIDLAVHRAKDVAVPSPEGLTLGAVLKRDSACDCFLGCMQRKLSELPRGARIGASSLRRRIQLRRAYPELVAEPLYGSIGTRMRKMKEGNLDGILLAYAGIKRLGLDNYVSEVLPEEQFYPAPGQGIIVVQILQGDPEMSMLLKPLQHLETGRELECERAFLRRLGGGSQLPCGIHVSTKEGKITASGILFSSDGTRCAEKRSEGNATDPILIGEHLADLIMARGGQDILNDMRVGKKNKGEGLER